MDDSLRPNSIQLTGHQRTLYEALAGEDKRLAGMYIGALMALSQEDNPVRMSLAAHSLRELIDKLPIYRNTQILKKPSDMKSKVHALSNQWVLASRSKCRSETEWSGEIDKPLKTLLKSTGEFFDWFVGEQPIRKERTQKTLQSLDVLSRPLPKAISKLRIEEWDLCHEYFVRVAHQGTPDEFAARIYQLELVLLDLLSPRTYEDHAIIDAIIQEAEMA